jgi:hypothetical protein
MLRASVDMYRYEGVTVSEIDPSPTPKRAGIYNRQPDRRWKQTHCHRYHRLWSCASTQSDRLELWRSFIFFRRSRRKWTTPMFKSRRHDETHLHKSSAGRTGDRVRYAFRSVKTPKESNARFTSICRSKAVVITVRRIRSTRHRKVLTRP